MITVDVKYHVHGTTLPADHGYALYGALSRIVPAIHSGEDGVGVHPVSGSPTGGRKITLTPKSSLTLRVPDYAIPRLLPLAGKRLEIDGSSLVVGTPEIHVLRPAAALKARLVTIKGFMEGDAFLEAVRRQLAALEIRGEPSLVPRRGEAPLEGGRGTETPFVTRTLRVRDKRVVGFALAVSGLDAAESIRLQEKGIGGRRRFGCGVFVPGRPG